jgi:hypothetical protein
MHDCLSFEAAGARNPSLEREDDALSALIE